MAPSDVITVAVVSPLSVVARGLSEMLADSPAVEMVELRTGAGWPDPDVVLYDSVGLHVGDGSDLDFFVTGTTSSVVAIGQDLRPALTHQALTRGAHSVVAMSAGRAQLVEAVLAASHGSGLRPAPASLKLGHEVGLTDREVDVLTLITQGFSNQEIAEHRYLSINSVKTYIRSAYRRIGVTSRAQAVLWCVQHGFPTEIAA